jgi:hypothetical protein
MTIDITPKAVERLAGPRTHICWTPDGIPKHMQELVVLLRASDFDALSAALKDKQDDTYLRGFNAGQLSLKNAGEFTVIDSPELADLRAALTASQAETAAAYEVAAHILDIWATNLRNMNFHDTAPIVEQCAALIRALTPADSKAALDRMLADARADGMRKAAAHVYEVFYAVVSKYRSSSEYLGAACDDLKKLDMDAILAAIPKGTPHE